ncbi:MerR family transcriptional regulator [Weissella paramesenteroides]
MLYTVKKMAEISGVSTRTLRYYDEISLLKPAQINESGYRLYGEKEINRLQQILFYRELNLKLEDIKKILDQPNFSVERALAKHYQKLLMKKARIESLMASIEKTMRYYRGEIKMADTEKFTAFKEQQILENEQQYGEEIREKYGENEVNESNRKFLQLTEADLEDMKATEKLLFHKLQTYLTQVDVNSDLAQEIFTLHKQWLSYTLPNYSSEIHKGIGEMYVGDDRFKSYYDRNGSGTAEALNNIIQHYAN